MKESDLNLLIKILSKINLNSETAYDELYDLFTHGFNMPIIFVPLKKGSICYRSRNNNTEDYFESFSDLSYPEKYILKYSRANKPGQQIFCCSDSYGTTLTELLPYWSKDLKIGDTFSITISQWIFLKEIYVACIPDFENVRLMTLLEKKIDFKNDITLMKYWEFINSFFRAQGLYQPNIYKFSSAFCNALFNNSQVMGEDINGIIYTSVQDLTVKGWNLAISPKFVDENLKLKNVSKFILQKGVGNNGKPSNNNFSNPEPVFAKHLDFKSGKIIWF